ncbi:hypothetical protein ACIBI9_02315 [Nonomuraea sp. NPDC050451]|uniref:hypothetical protein n=1 Tax=Nonomuraea sp. NPDC050451 TaxID=3364364 RepID=UPI0037B5BE55
MRGRPGPSELAEVTAWASANLHLPISVADLARRGMQSTRTLHRNFQTRFGMSPRAFATTPTAYRRAFAP